MAGNTRVWAFCLAVLLVALPGCGTLLNVTDGGMWVDSLPAPTVEPLPPGSPFGGVWQDVARWSQSVERLPDEPGAGTLSCLFFLADMPLSLAGDAITMPYVLWMFANTVEKHDPRPAE
jgi:hypothetical protein